MLACFFQFIPIHTITHQLPSLYYIYADNLQIYKHGAFEDLNRTIDSMNIDMATIFDLCEDFRLNINPLIGHKYLL